MRIVLAHERSHIRQGDFYLQLIAGFYTAIFWISPLGWWLKHKLSDLGEAISDRAALDEAASRASYAQVLLEFAAMPRPTLLGVAMASRNNLSHRIERLLNNTIFHQAFGAGRRRILLAVMLVPLAVFVGTALVRVEAAGAGAATGSASPSTPCPTLCRHLESRSGAGHSHFGQADSRCAPCAGQHGHAAAATARRLWFDHGSRRRGVDASHAASAARLRGDSRLSRRTGRDDCKRASERWTNTVANGRSTAVSKGYSYSYSSNGDSWALVTGPDEQVTFSGDWHKSTRDSINKVRKLTGGKFLWFTHEGKTYFIDDPAMMVQIEAMYKPMQELGRRQEELGKLQEELGKQQEKLGHQQEQAQVPAPDISKEMAELNAAVAKLDAKKGSTVSQEELAEIEGRIGDIQGRLGDLQGRMGDEQGKLGELQGKLGEQQGRLGEEQGRLGEEEGRLAGEADRKVKAMIAASLQSGKARPVE